MQDWEHMEGRLLEQTDVEGHLKRFVHQIMQESVYHSRNDTSEYLEHLQLKAMRETAKHTNSQMFKGLGKTSRRGGGGDAAAHYKRQTVRENSFRPPPHPEAGGGGALSIASRRSVLSPAVASSFPGSRQAPHWNDSPIKKRAESPTQLLKLHTPHLDANMGSDAASEDPEVQKFLPVLEKINKHIFGQSPNSPTLVSIADAGMRLDDFFNVVEEQEGGEVLKSWEMLKRMINCTVQDPILSNRNSQMSMLELYHESLMEIPNGSDSLAFRMKTRFAFGALTALQTWHWNDIVLAGTGQRTELMDVLSRYTMERVGQSGHPFFWPKVYFAIRSGKWDLGIALVDAVTSDGYAYRSMRGHQLLRALKAFCTFHHQHVQHSVEEGVVEACKVESQRCREFYMESELSLRGRVPGTAPPISASDRAMIRVANLLGMVEINPDKVVGDQTHLYVSHQRDKLFHRLWFVAHGPLLHHFDDNGRQSIASAWSELADFASKDTSIARGRFALSLSLSLSLWSSLASLYSLLFHLDASSFDVSSALQSSVTSLSNKQGRCIRLLSVLPGITPI
jgi:hypothetical protein